MKPAKHSGPRLYLGLALGAVLATVLSVQCVRTYLYTGSVLVPEQAQREVERQIGALSTAARIGGIVDASGLGTAMEHVIEAAPERVFWMRVLDPEGNVLAQAGSSYGTPTLPPRWRERMENHESLLTVTDTRQGKAFVAMLPFRIPRPPSLIEKSWGQPNPPVPPGARADSAERPPGGPHGPPFIIELAVSFTAVEGAFDGLRRNLIVGLIASIALLASLALIWFRTPQYLRGKYLENELQLARRVQSDLRPKPHSISRHVTFAASAVAADHVGGDFYDIFETASGEISIVLGDASGKGVSAALLVSVLQGAIRSSTSRQHEYACERINRMLCERTAGARFATLFWGVFDPVRGTLRYVNAGHVAPMLIRSRPTRVERLNEGGPVVGLLPMARYSAGTIEMEPDDTLVLYSDGINEAMNQSEEEFGENRIVEMVTDDPNAEPPEICERVMKRVTAFASGGPAPDDRTCMVVRFLPSGTGRLQVPECEDTSLEAVA